MKIFITGGCGYVGTVLTESLLSDGHQITVLDTQWFGNFLKEHKSLKIIMDKEFAELGINKKETKKTIVKKETKKIDPDSYTIVVGTFKYRNSAEKQIKLIQSKYPKTTAAKKSSVVLIKVSGKQLYESRFENFSKQEAYTACKRLKKYNRDCFIRS